MITDRDMEIMRDWFEVYRFATIEQLEKAYFREQQYSYNICRRRLGKLKETGYIKVVRDAVTNRNIYILNEEKIKPPSMQRMILLDVLAEMKYNGFNVEMFDIEKFWNDGKIRSDAFCIFTVNNRRYHFFVEVQVSNHHHNLEKYDKLYESGEVKKFLQKDFFPRILFVSDRKYQNITLQHTSVIQLDTKLHGFATILI